MRAREREGQRERERESRERERESDAMKYSFLTEENEYFSLQEGK